MTADEPLFRFEAVSTEVPARGITAVDPSGTGKNTLLRLLQPARGTDLGSGLMSWGTVLPSTATLAGLDPLRLRP